MRAKSVAALFTMLALAVAAPLFAPAQPEQDPVSAELLAKHRAYVGWQLGDGKYDTIHITGRITNGRGILTAEFDTITNGLLYRTTTTLLQRDGIVEENGYTGNIFWRSDINGFTTPVYGDYAHYLASLTLLLREGTTELPANFLGDRTVDGKLLRLVQVTLTNGDPIDLYIDPETGAYVQATIDPSGPYETAIRILGYTKILPGTRAISSYRIGGDATYTYETIKPGAPLPNEMFHPPAPSATWSFTNYKPIPIVLTRDRILVNAVVDGVAGRFILDTGASSIVLDEAFAQRANLPVLAGTSEAATIYGPIATRLRRAATMTFGGATLQNVLVASEDFRNRDFRGLDQAGYDGLIGYDFFAGAIVKLDVYHSTMTILDPAADLTGVSGVPFLLDLSEGVPAIPMTINKSIPVKTYLDTGNPGIAFLSYELGKKYDLRIGSPVCGNLDSLTLGPLTYTGQSVCLENFGSDDMLVGYDFLKHFDYIFDYPHGRLILAPNKN
jgi:hypothetical protein